MRDLVNIEKSGFRGAGQYVGYAAYKDVSVVYRITRDGKGWKAVAAGAPTLYQPPLMAMSDSLMDLTLTAPDA